MGDAINRENMTKILNNIALKQSWTLPTGLKKLLIDKMAKEIFAPQILELIKAETKDKTAWPKNGNPNYYK